MWFRGCWWLPSESHLDKPLPVTCGAAALALATLSCRWLHRRCGQSRRAPAVTKLRGAALKAAGNVWSPPAHLALPPALDCAKLMYRFSWEPFERPCNFDVDVGCVALDAGGGFLRAVHIAEKGAHDTGLAHSRQRRRLVRGEKPCIDLLGDECIEVDLSRIERAAAFLIFVHMVYAPGPITFQAKVASCCGSLVDKSDGDVICSAEGFSEDNGGALVSAVLWRQNRATATATGSSYSTQSGASNWRFDCISRCVPMPCSASHSAMVSDLWQICLSLGHCQQRCPQVLEGLGHQF